MYASDCPFCTPPSERVIAETNFTRTLLDAFPISPGHTLVVPMRHFADAFEATDVEMAEIWQALFSAAVGLRGTYRPAGFNIGVNSGLAAGQTVMHLHWHLIPRYSGDQADPRGGIRRIFPDLADYWSRAK